MSEYGFEKDEVMTLAKAARSMQGVLYTSNPCEMPDEDTYLVTGNRKHFRRENTMIKILFVCHGKNTFSVPQQYLAKFLKNL